MRAVNYLLPAAAFLLHSTLAPAPAHCGFYMEDFEADSGGWRDGNFGTVQYTRHTSGGVGDSAYMESSRIQNLPGFHAPVSGDAAAALHGDLEATFGEEIDISYSAKIFQGDIFPDANIGHIFRSASDFWRAEIISGPTAVQALKDDWTLLSFSINTNWSDAEAAANGWVQTGTTSWADTMAAVTSQNFMHGGGYFGNPTINGIDNITVSSAAVVPAPPSIVLLGIGGLTFLGFRRRQGRKTEFSV